MSQNSLFPGWVVFCSHVYRSLGPVRWPVDGLPCLPTVVGNAAGNVGAQMPASLFSVPGAGPGVGAGCGSGDRLAGPRSRWPSARQRLMSRPHQQRVRACFSACSQRMSSSIFFFFDSSHPGGYQVVSHCGFDWHSPVTEDGIIRSWA